MQFCGYLLMVLDNHCRGLGFVCCSAGFSRPTEDLVVIVCFLAIMMICRVGFSKEFRAVDQSHAFVSIGLPEPSYCFGWLQKPIGFLFVLNYFNVVFSMFSMQNDECKKNE